MKKLIICLATLAIVVGFGAMKAEAADISVTVTMQEIAVSVSPDTWTIGPIPEGDTDTLSVTATNDGNVTEDFDIALSETTVWAVGTSFPTPGTDTFTMTQDGIGTETAITGTASDLKDDVITDVTFNLKFYAPTDDTLSGYTAQSITVTVTASAS